jgi:hypothetical protein
MHVSRYAGSTFVECGVCGYAQLCAPEPNAEYWEPSREDKRAGHCYRIGAKQRHFDSSLVLLGDSTPGRRLLDVGGGIGYFAERARARMERLLARRLPSCDRACSCAARPRASVALGAD